MSPEEMREIAKKLRPENDTSYLLYAAAEVCDRLDDLLRRLDDPLNVYTKVDPSERERGAGQHSPRVPSE